MARLLPVLIILFSYLFASAAADNGNYFVYPAKANGSSSRISTTLYEGTSVVVQWETTWKSVGLWLTQEGNPIPLPFPDAQNLDPYVHLFPWTVDLSGKNGNPAFDLSKRDTFYFSIIQNGTIGAGVFGSFHSEPFIISNTGVSSGSVTKPSKTSIPSEPSPSTSAEKNFALPSRRLSYGASCEHFYATHAPLTPTTNIHHIDSNVHLNAKRRLKDSEEVGHSDVGSSERRYSNPALQNDSTAPVPYSYRGVLELWKFVAFVQTKEEHEKAWVRLCEEFNDQRAILAYLYKTYLPLSAQWAHCFIKKYHNFGIRVTSGIEASNNNVQSYLLNGTCHLYRLVEAIEGMLIDQERGFIDICSQGEVLTAGSYSGPGSEYLGEFRMVMSQPGLDLLAKEQRRALKSIPSSVLSPSRSEIVTKMYYLLVNGDPLPSYNLYQIGSRDILDEMGCPPSVAPEGV
ncbi:uncharacterized protein TRIVIDRAFT_70960 [Trichoderma virens Gv29-8]|uniref:Uncharacterized protein n=1 Tax=Hypocrea virens (strain Gv29-8 / FGSC 10586) TaxID=413071 RepID=G9MU91_HYPVG|nr:uncharacterized protein TRIVIDRAFT_70960 [Trichoderma virens Gv29-8]EHK21997.1 hypothetical protein TRIVIDRAFT_70960 [Trichoderma virens Gv29-8]UKZ48250.1 hypothetical protein TrVGV298_002486 [Trichoderma virens]